MSFKETILFSMKFGRKMVGEITCNNYWLDDIIEHSSDGEQEYDK